MKERVFRAGFWSASGFALNLVIRFGSSLLMTRLLLPEMFGLMSLATTFIVGLSMFSDLGLRQFVVQSARGSDPAYLNTAWSIQIVRGAVLCMLTLGLGIVFLVAQRWSLLPANSVYASPDLPAILGALSLTSFVTGFTSTRLLEANRSLALGLVTRNEVAAQLFGLLVMVIWVSIDRSVWALVAGNLGSNFCRVVLSHFWLPGVRNRWYWNEAAAREILGLGKWIFLASILGFLVNSGDQLLLAGLVDSKTLGLYVIAALYVSSTEAILAKLMNDVSLPTFSEIVRERRRDLKRNYYRFHLLLAAVSYTSSGFLIMFGPSMIHILYDKRYAAAGAMVAALAPLLLTLPFRLSTQSFLALGRAELQSHTLAIRLLSLFILAPVGFYLYGFWGALTGVVLSQFSYIPLIIFYNVRHDLFDYRREVASSVFFLGGIGLGWLCSSVADRIFT
ncbi:oligosaccharide flippase family protein [Bradyrhizobium manausense]|uniref:oligosaccharide flippase family protein n=1 Tax=Bradyrhizobium manausense TaxID=989370 RepID=UPI001BA9334E|nr:oligosaccharide flippase family protein [Bradyrhizobium manausense]MBR0836972.1 oligosaccharide flippase family protein [Bradyrhizobium manausense]